MKTKSKNLLTVLGFVGLFFITTGISWAIFSLIKGTSPIKIGTTAPAGTTKSSRINLNLPKTEECPINGQKYTKQEKDIWMDRRPITAAIENHMDSRPQSGLSRSDVIYEAVAEGGITRFLVVFYCGASADDVRIGPVRSARVYFINFAAEYLNPLFVHVGGANNICRNCPGGVKPAGDVARDVNAFALLDTLGWRYATGNALDGGTNVGYPIVWRDPERIPGAATEHTFMGSTDKLFDEGKKRGFGYNDKDGKAWNKSFEEWKFADDRPVSTPTASNISFVFWDNKPEYDVEWKWDSKENKYMRFTGGKEHIDMDSKEQLFAKDVVVVFADERGPVDKEGHMFYKNVGVTAGKGFLFQNGGVTKIKWTKKSGADRIKFFDEKGVGVSLVRGRVWIEMVPTGNEIKYN